MQWIKEADRALSLQQLDKVERLFNQIEEREPWRSLGWTSLAEENLEQGNPNAVLRLLEPWAESGQLDARGWLLLADAHTEMGNHERVELSLQEAYRLAEEDDIRVEVLWALAAHYRDVKEFQKALDCLNELSLHVPTANGQLEIDRILLTTVLNPERGYSMSVVYPNKPDWMSDWQTGIKAALETVDADTRLLEIGRTFAAAGIYDLAEYHFQTVVNKTPDYADAWALLAESRQQQGKDGRVQIEKALSLMLESPGVRLAGGLYYRRQKDFTKALTLFSSAVEDWPYEPVWQLELARTQAEAGRLEEATLTYEKLIRDEPENVETYLSLARICLQFEYRLQDVALPAAEKAAVLQPEAAAPQDVIGQILFALGEPEKAREFFNLAREIDPMYAPVWLHVGQMALSESDYSLAKDALLKTAELSENSYEGKLAARLLKQYFNMVP